MKKYLGILMSIIMVLSISTPIFAEELIDHNNDAAPEIVVDIIEQTSPDIQIGEEQTEENDIDEGLKESDNITDEQNRDEQKAEDNEEHSEDVIVPTISPTEMPAVTEAPSDLISTPAPEEMDKDQNDISELSLGTPEYDVWTNLAPMNEGRANADCFTIAGELYAVGGTGETGYLGTIEKYNEENNLWQIVTSVPGELKGFAVAATDTDIYIVGGYENEEYSNKVQVYNIETETWSDITSMQEKRDLAAAFCMDNKLYVLGGRNKDGFVNSYEFYDFTDGCWNKVTTGFAESMIRTGARARYIQGFICVYGGIDQEYSYAGVDLYLASDLENEQAVLAEGYRNVSIAWGENKAIILAGDDYSTRVKKELVISDDTFVLSDAVIATTASMKYSQYVIYNGYMRCIGGYNTNGYMNSFSKYSVYYGDFLPGEGTIENEITSAGNQTTLNVETGKEYMLFINVTNADVLSDYTFTVEYPANSFEVIDGCAMTAEKDIKTGDVSGADISVTELKSNGISFICTEELSGESAVTKGINAILLKANSSGQRTIKYSMTID